MRKREAISKRARAMLDEIVASVKATYASISAGAYVHPEPLGIDKLSATAEFNYEPATAEVSDLVIQFTCAPAKHVLLGDGTRPFAQVENDAVWLQLQRGTGEVLAELEPHLLPADEESPRYADELLDYLERARQFLEKREPLILDALRTPFLR